MLNSHTPGARNMFLNDWICTRPSLLKGALIMGEVSLQGHDVPIGSSSRFSRATPHPGQSLHRDARRLSTCPQLDITVQKMPCSRATRGTHSKPCDSSFTIMPKPCVLSSESTKLGMKHLNTSQSVVPCQTEPTKQGDALICRLYFSSLEKNSCPQVACV